MGKIILSLLILGVLIYALVDAVRAPATQVRVMSKWLWVLVIVLFSVIGAVLWFVFGRPVAAKPGPGGSPGGGGGGATGGGPWPRPRGPVAPDDDPEFLKHLDEQSWASRMEQLRRERSGQPEEGGPDPTAPQKE